VREPVLPDSPTPGLLGIAQTTDADGVMLVLNGELDLSSAPELEALLRELESSNPGRILIDLHELKFMDSSGLALLIRAQQMTTAAGCRLELRPGPNQVQRLFEMTGTLDRFTFVPA
jgi:anti-sigma B factor antagonist